MTRQTVCSVCFLFVLFILILFSGLSLCEQGLYEVSGMNITPGAFTLVNADGTWTIILTGHRYSFDSSRISHYLRRQFADEN